MKAKTEEKISLIQRVYLIVDSSETIQITKKIKTI